MLSNDDRLFIAHWGRAVIFNVAQVGGVVFVYFAVREGVAYYKPDVWWLNNLPALVAFVGWLSCVFRGWEMKREINKFDEREPEADSHQP